jgi:hypothetical protein
MKIKGSIVVDHNEQDIQVTGTIDFNEDPHKLHVNNIYSLTPTEPQVLEKTQEYSNAVNSLTKELFAFHDRN